jgi:hypothetical protein
MGKQFPIWVLGSVVVFAAADAAVGPVIAGSIAGNSGITVGQAVLIDRENFSLLDFGPMIDDAVVAINDDGTSFTMCLELQVGEEIVIDLPLANQSDASASILATLVTSPGLRKAIKPFWGSSACQKPSPRSSPS